ncbi:outer membrane protein assembly factor BamB family protein [Actinoplanes sp. HUAS TT8]|uniref:outer membrane protein assembly factor BamB family protein n=1 Tax=Actinoplanes sp. HUAS TT8 TaxID=3447453 RepID=UPI003F51C84B
MPGSEPHDQDHDNLAYATGTAAAATPTPTPQTVSHEPPVHTDTNVDEPSRQYATPVDPWAEGEAQARASGAPLPYSMDPPTSPASPGPSAFPADTTAATVPEYLRSGPGAGSPPYRKGFWILGGAALAAAVALGVTAALLLRPAFPALDYHSLEEVARLQPIAPITSGWSDAEVIGDRAYFAGVDAQGQVGVTAFDTDSAKEAWKSTAAGPARSWAQMIALPGAVALISDPDYTTSQARLVVLDGKTGKLRWEYTLGSSDTVHFGAGVVLVVDREQGQLRGLDLATGKERWKTANPDGSASSTVLDVTTPDDLTGPAGSRGRPFAPDLADDDQVVQIASDRSARVIDVSTGKAGTPRADVAYTSDKMVAHNGRLFVEESSSDRLLAYDLAKLDTAEPAILYTAPKDAQVDALTPCGDDRICFVETVGYARDKAQIIAYDVKKHQEAWRKPAAGAEALIPVGDEVLAVADDTTTLFDATGKTRWAGTPGAAVRLNAGNVLQFSDTLSTSVSGRTLVGIHPGDEPVQLGLLRDVRSSTCAWNTSVLACVAEKDYVVTRFAG